MRLIPKDWSDHQHYKDRNPPWIKLHNKLLKNRAFMRLPLASKAIAPLLWLLASESNDGSFDASIDELVFRLHMSEREIQTGLKPLIKNGFFLDASTMLAPCLQDAIPEREREAEADREGETQYAHSRFDDFWAVYPKGHKSSKKKALDKWKAKRLDDIADKIIHDVEDRIERDTKWLGGFIPDVLTYINQERWDGDICLSNAQGSYQPGVSGPDEWAEEQRSATR